MDLPEIKALIDAMASADLTEMEIAKEGWTLRLVRRPGSGLTPLTQPAMAPASNAPSAQKVVREREADALMVKAPLAGTVYLSSSPAEPAFVEVGSSVVTGATLCVIEAMKVFNAVKAERDGTIAALLVSSGDEVESGQALLRFG